MIKSFYDGINVKSAMITIVAIFIYIFASDFLIHGVILKPAYQDTADLWRPETAMPHYMIWMIFGQFIIAKYFVLIFAKGYENKGVFEGVRFGLLAGMLMIAQNFIFYSVMPLPLSLAINWVVLGLIQAVGAGIVASLVYRR